MKQISFDRIWEDAIRPVIESKYELCSQIESSKEYSFRLCNEDKLKKHIQRDYNKVKYELKSCYYKEKDDVGDGEENLIDTHKIAACLSYSMICNKPFSFVVLNYMPQEIFLSNYFVAYHVSLAFIYMTLISEYEINGYHEYANILLKKGCLEEPPVSKGHNSFNEGRIFALAQNDFYGNEFDLLGYADMMFWVELYTRQCVEKRVEPVELDRIMSIEDA